MWIEAPAASLGTGHLSRLASLGARGIVAHADATPEMLTLLRPIPQKRPSAEPLDTKGDHPDEGILMRARRLGLQARVRLRADADTFGMVVPMARWLAPVAVTLEISRRGGDGRSAVIRPQVVEEAFLQAGNLTFEHHRLEGSAYLPPCAMPRVWDSRPKVWRTLLAERRDEKPNDIFPICKNCELSLRCGFSDKGALGSETLERISAVRPRSSGNGSGRRRPVPSEIARLRSGPEITCIMPWTVMEIVDPVGLVNHCCKDWTVGSRGNTRVRSLSELWNGPNFRAARRRMLGLDPGPLCHSICPRLNDRKFAENELEIMERSDRFVENQLQLAEDLALRREEVRAKPLYMVLCPTTACNYDCIMCSYGRLPRRDLPESVLAQVDEFLPTLRTLTLLGGEPLVSRAVMDLLRRFERDKYPDGGVDLVTNGSLLTKHTLDRIGGCAFGAVVISLNAGTAETYERVHGGARMQPVLNNLDQLLRHREKHGHFGIKLSFVVQPLATPGLIEFGEIAAARDLDIRLLPMTPHSRGPAFYDCAESVTRVLDDLDAFTEWARARRPAWLEEIAATRDAIAKKSRLDKLEREPALGQPSSKWLHTR